MSSRVPICVVVPVYNHGLTVGRVIRDARRHFSVIAVNDGSTDQTAEALAAEPGLETLTLPCNQGKGAALEAGFARARQLGYTHAITLDADGQHPVEALPVLAQACRQHPEALIVGIRDLKAAGAPRARRFSNDLSSFWFKVETGLALPDTQTGLRCYPLATVARLQITASRYAWELEILVRAAWAGVPLVARQVGVDYQAPTSRLSHFDPVRDFLHISRLHGRLALQALICPTALRYLAGRASLEGLPRKHRIRTFLRRRFKEANPPPGRIALAVGLGLFSSVTPIGGYRAKLMTALAGWLRLNPTATLTASKLSFPLATPLLLAAGLVLGHLVRTGDWLAFGTGNLGSELPLYVWDAILGCLILAAGFGLGGLLVTYSITRSWARRMKEPDPE